MTFNQSDPQLRSHDTATLFAPVVTIIVTWALNNWILIFPVQATNIKDKLKHLCYVYLPSLTLHSTASCLPTSKVSQLFAPNSHHWS